MGVEVLVLGRDEGVLDEVGHLLDRDEQALLAVELGDDDALARVGAAHHGRAVVDELARAGQVTVVDVYEPRYAADGEDESVREEAEERADEADHVAQSVVPLPLTAGRRCA